MKIISLAAQGLDALVIGRLTHQQGSLVHISQNERSMDALAERTRFFFPDLDVLCLPAWDCFPYDRMSPNPQICARRLHTLVRLLEENQTPRLLLTTVAASLQRLIPRGHLVKNTLFMEPTQQLERDLLFGFLHKTGFVRTDIVREAAEYAPRGSLIDIFPPGANTPVRLDFFGNTLESLRSFDVQTQRTLDPLKNLHLLPANEILLTSETITQFRDSYRRILGTSHGDPLYEGVKVGHRPAGIESFLPLFYKKTHTVRTYMPQGAVVVEEGVQQTLEERLEDISECYQARNQAKQKALPPTALFLDHDEWHKTFAPAVCLSPYRQPGAEQQGRKGRDFAPERKTQNVFTTLKEHIRTLHGQGKKVLIACGSPGSADRLSSIFTSHHMPPLQQVSTWSEAEQISALSSAVLAVEHGFETHSLAVITEQDILGTWLIHRRRLKRTKDTLSHPSELTVGECVVHVDHGIGCFEGLESITAGGSPHDCAVVTYKGGDKLFVPVENIDLLSRYGAGTPTLDKLGSGRWKVRCEKVRKNLLEMAQLLIGTAATRATSQAERFEVPEEIYQEFCARFPHEETDDQHTAMGDVIADLKQGRPMDRLICGDVGFGKTEIAMRAACIVASAGAQVAVLAPTTLLCRQHYQTFSQRFRELPMNVGHLSRLVPPQAAKKTRQDLAQGSLDIVIGSHALLGKEIVFHNLGLVIVDEEQHFGVRQKERLKLWRENVHMLALSATPIPRTLHMAISGLRDLSLITTPPVDRMAVRSFIMPFDPPSICTALRREHNRNGQSFYICPRIRDLPYAQEFLKRALPELKVTTVHGKMSPSNIETRMAEFYDGRSDLLLSTPIIESGLDIPRANTLVVERSYLFGLAQLHQLRGRIGRARARAYAYFTLPPHTPLPQNAHKRLRTLQSLDTLGASFSLAAQDLDIRGAGNILGKEQSGHIREVGYELYQSMLQEVVSTLKAKEEAFTAPVSPHIAFGGTVRIPKTYVNDMELRLSLYRQASRLESDEEIEAFGAELFDRFGTLPPEVETLLKIVSLKILGKKAHVERVEAGHNGITLRFSQKASPTPAHLVEFLDSWAGRARFRPDHSLFMKMPLLNPEEELTAMRTVLTSLAQQPRESLR